MKQRWWLLGLVRFCFVVFPFCRGFFLFFVFCCIICQTLPVTGSSEASCHRPPRPATTCSAQWERAAPDAELCILTNAPFLVYRGFDSDCYRPVK